MLINEYFPCEDGDKVECFIADKDIRHINEKIMNEYSRNIFENRLLYSLTGNYEHIRRIVLGTEAGKKMNRLLYKPSYIYGAGKRGKLLVETFGNKQWQGFIDVNKNGNYEGYPVYRWDDFTYQGDASVVISNKYGYDEIRRNLVRDKKVPEEKIIILEHFYKMADIERYFEPEPLKAISMEDQVFMDLGCYDGVDTIRALDFWKGENINVCAVEPDRKNYLVCKDNFKGYEGITLINRGIGEKKEKKNFIEGGEGARFSDAGDKAVEIDTIDHIANGNTVGFIKMDIEGYEEEALLGGQKTIKRCKPVLAVCIYHKRSDVWRIPLKILELNDSYRFYLGHYTLDWGDTVLYAVDKKDL